MLIWFLPLFLLFLLIGLPVFFGLLANNPKNTGNPINKNNKNKGRNQINIIETPIFVYLNPQVILTL